MASRKVFTSSLSQPIFILIQLQSQKARPASTTTAKIPSRTGIMKTKSETTIAIEIRPRMRLVAEVRPG